MRTALVYLLLICFFRHIHAQHESPFFKAFQIKPEPLEFVYTFPRLGLGFEQKFEKHSLWVSFHYGWDGLPMNLFNQFDEGPIHFWGINTGLKRIYPNSAGEFYWGLQMTFDKTSAERLDDVYYDLRKKEAVLFDKATFQRNRIGLFIENGYEFFITHRLSLEISTGIGTRLIDRWYTNVDNPFRLTEIEPITFRRKYQHKYVHTTMNLAFTSSIKIGFRI